MNRRSVLLFWGGSSLAISGHSQGPMSRVRMLVVDSFGRGVAERVTVTINGNGISKTIYITEAGFVEVPIGTYSLECRADHFISVRRFVKVQSSAMDVLLGLALKDANQILGEASPSVWTVSGHVRVSQPAGRFS
jgi:hypothetical protein